MIKFATLIENLKGLFVPCKLPQRPHIWVLVEAGVDHYHYKCSRPGCGKRVQVGAGFSPGPEED